MGEVLERIRAKMAAGCSVSAVEIAHTRQKSAEADFSLRHQIDLCAVEQIRPEHPEHYVRRNREEIRADEERRTKLREQWRQADLQVELRRERARRDPEELRRFVKYRLEPDEYKRLLAQQNGACAICREKPKRTLCVDHDHKTGRVRSLLCGHCNSAIGFLRESPLLARAAATYLEQQLTKEFTGE